MMGAIQKAVYAALAADADIAALVSTRIYDHAPQNTAFPYIVFGQPLALQYDTQTTNGVDQEVWIDVWDRPAAGVVGRKGVMDIGQAIYDVLHRRGLTVINDSGTRTARTWDGVSDYATRGANLMGATDSDKLLCSVWFQRAGSGTRQIWRSGDGRQTLFLNAGNQVVGSFKNSSGTTLLAFTTGAVPTGWNHLAFCYNNGAGSVYLNGVAVTPSTLTAGTLDFTATEWLLCANTAGGAFPFAGDLFDLWVGYGRYLDLSVAGNLQKFRTSEGYAAEVGGNGENVTGTPPIFYSRDGSEVNLGTGGALALNGALAVAASKPTTVYNHILTQCELRRAMVDPDGRTYHGVNIYSVLVA